MASAEGGSVPSGVGYGEGYPLSSQLRGLGKRREPPPSGVRAENGFWHISKATERSFLYLYDKFALAPSAPNSGGLVPLSLRDLCPCS